MSQTESRSYLVECYWPGVSTKGFAKSAERIQEEASKLAREGGDIVFRGSILVLADESVFCLFDGSESDIRTASERAGMRFDRVLESMRIAG
jgi:hypothetical protein